MNDILTEMTKIAQKISVCEGCQLHLSRKMAVPGEGSVITKVLFIGEGPGVNENETGRPFVGQAGAFLNELLASAKINRADVFITNVVKCRPPANRDPMPEELKACSAYLDQQIELINPLAIVTLGRFSMGRYFPLQRISAIHGKGQWINGRMVVPMFHPAAALHQPSLKASILYDFSMLPRFIEEAAERMASLAVAPKEEESVAPVEEEETPMNPSDQENGAVQLSFF